MNTGKLIYLACPYSHPNYSVQCGRFQSANRAAAKLFAQGEMVFSPISHTHPIAVAGGLPGDWQFWKEYDTAMLSICKKLVVLKLDGWDRSTGVAAEIALAESMGLPVEYLEP